jgi:hypothetical protein
MRRLSMLLNVMVIQVACVCRVHVAAHRLVIVSYTSKTGAASQIDCTQIDHYVLYLAEFKSCAMLEAHAVQVCQSETVPEHKVLQSVREGGGSVREDGEGGSLLLSLSLSLSLSFRERALQKGYVSVTFQAPAVQVCQSETVPEHKVLYSSRRTSRRGGGGGGRMERGKSITEGCSVTCINPPLLNNL